MSGLLMMTVAGPASRARFVELGFRAGHAVAPVVDGVLVAGDGGHDVHAGHERVVLDAGHLNPSRGHFDGAAPW
jgi:hypothetical protein